MTYRKLSSLWFKVWSPSHYELCARDDGSDISLVSLVFTGADWRILVLMKRGHTITREGFASRDDAVALIAGRRAA